MCGMSSVENHFFYGVGEVVVEPEISDLIDVEICVQGYSPFPPCIESQMSYRL
jgi:hypothetical protein